MKKTPVILQSRKECYLCRKYDHSHNALNLERHHIMNGPFRDKSEETGGVVWLCAYHHRIGGKDCVHENKDLRLEHKQDFEKKFLESHEKSEWMEIFRKDYL